MLGLCGCDDAIETTQLAIFTTLTECVSLIGLDEQLCRDALDPIKVSHASTGPAYPFAAVCEQVEGKGDCEQSHDQLWRPKVVAYMAMLGSKPRILPLYPTLDGQRGFRRDDGALLRLDDRALKLITVSAKKSLAGAE